MLQHMWVKVHMPANDAPPSDSVTPLPHGSHLYVYLSFVCGVLIGRFGLCGLLRRAIGPGSGARLDRPVGMGHSALLLCLWPIAEGHGAKVWCQTGQASRHGPLCLVVMLVAYCRGPWGQGLVPDWTGQSARATLPCCYACGLLQRAMGPGSGARLDRPVGMGHSALLLCLWPIEEGHGARVQCQTGQASRHGPLCLVMLVAYHGVPWGQGLVPDWTGQSAWATLPCCYLPEHCSQGTLQGILEACMAHGDLMGN